MKRKKIIIISIVMLVLLLAGFLLLRTGIQWDDSIRALGYEVNVSDIHNLKIRVNVRDLFYNEDELAIYLNGKPVRNGLDLSSQVNGFGTYILEAEYKGHFIEKEFCLVKDYSGFDPENRLTSLLLDHSPDYYENLDTDGDGITDKEELERYGTDPYNADTDGDGYIDTHELFLGLDPLEKDDFGKMREYTIDKGPCRVHVSGYGNIADVFVDEVHVKELEQNDFVIGNIYELCSPLQFSPHVEGVTTIESVQAVFDLSSAGSPDDVGIFAYDRKTGKVSWLESVIDKKSNTMSAPIANLQIFGLAYISKAPDQVKTEVALVIDNSGSMFPVEYVTEDTSSVNPSDYGHDAEFNRLSLMTELVDRLDDGKFLFSVGAFQAYYHRVTGMTDSKETVKTSIERLKAEFQNFSGTSIETAIDDGLKEFSQNSFNKKFMILLTDGYNATNWYQFPPGEDYVIGRAKNMRVEIIAIGLGDCDEEKLKRIASATGGIYIHARDSDALAKLLDRLLSSLGELEIDSDGDGAADMQIIADSGFRSEVDGFPFENFGDVNSPEGNCGGFAITAKLIYEKSLPYELKETRIRGLAALILGETKLKAIKLDESTIEMIKNNNVFDIHVPTLFMIDNQPSWNDLLNPDGDTAVIDPKYRQRLIDTGHIIKMVEGNGTIDGVSIKRYERAYFDAWSQKANENVPPAELDIIKLINRNQNAQIDSGISRMLGPVIIGIENLQTKSSLIQPLVELLDSGKPALVSMECPYGRHAVLVTRIAYDINDPNRIYLTMYDSNRPGLNAVATLERIKATREGEFYDKYKFEYNYSSLNFKTIMVTRIELLNGDTVFYRQ
ncbi:MAG: VWA domain-containing protein [Clostridiaceae bacterium]|nr:VWA domain-containing protein [Clostridiaceae bacterium]